MVLKLLIFGISLIDAQGIIIPDVLSTELFPSDPITNKLGTKGSAVRLPIKYSLKPFCPEPGNQNLYSIPACTGFAFGYGAMTILLNIQKNSTHKDSIANNVFSGYYPYHMSKSRETCIPINIEKVAESLKKYGNISAKEFDENYSCKTTRGYKFNSNIQSVYLRDIFKLYSPENKITKDLPTLIKTKLFNKTPVVCTINVDTTVFMNSNFKQELYCPNLDSLNKMIMHAVVAVAFDERDSTIEFLNSYGTNWGNKGFFKLKYNVLETLCEYAFTLSVYNVNDFVSNITFWGERESENSGYSFQQRKSLGLSETSALSVYESKQVRINVDPIVTDFNINSKHGLYLYAHVINKDTSILISKFENTKQPIVKFNDNGFNIFESGDILILLVSKTKMSLQFKKNSTVNQIILKLRTLNVNKSFTSTISNVSYYDNIFLNGTQNKTQLMFSIIKFI